MSRPSSFHRIWMAFLVGVATSVDAFGTTVVYGPAAKEMVLLTSKIAAKQGQESFCICAPGQEEISRKLMYGESDDTDNDDAMATPIASGQGIQDALTKASSLILVCHETPIEEKALNTLLASAGEDLTKIVLLSKMGVGGGGFFGDKVKDAEDNLRSVCKSKNLILSIIRAGQLKGGGPGEPSENDFGLSKKYYNTLFELSEASCTMAHDRFTLGVDCSRGDAVEVPNPLILFGTKTSFDAAPYDTNRINAATAAVLASLYDKPVEFSVGCDKGATPPSKEDWEQILEKMAV